MPQLSHGINPLGFGAQDSRPQLFHRQVFRRRRHLTSHRGVHRQRRRPCRMESVRIFRKGRSPRLEDRRIRHTLRISSKISAAPPVRNQFSFSATLHALSQPLQIPQRRLAFFWEARFGIFRRGYRIRLTAFVFRNRRRPRHRLEGEPAQREDSRENLRPRPRNSGLVRHRRFSAHGFLRRGGYAFRQGGFRFRTRFRECRLSR